MSFYVHKTTTYGTRKHVTEAQQKRKQSEIKRGKVSYFANKETCNQISIRRMPRPMGEAYDG